MNYIRWTKSFLILIFTCSLFINCPKRVSVKTSKIEVIYLSSLLEDIKKPEPYLCSIADTQALSVGYINFETPFMSQLFQRLGFYKFLSELPLDFLITNYPVYGYNFLPIPIDLGYGIKNIEGIRFGICSQPHDSLSISDQVKLATLRERSDVLWIVDKKLLSLPALQIDFIIRDRALQDTMIKNIKTVKDTIRQKYLNSFTQSLNQLLNAKIDLNKRTIAEYIFSRIKQKRNFEIMLYPAGLIKDSAVRDSMTIRQFLNNVACDIKFKTQELSEDEIKKKIRENGYQYKGTIAKKNIALFPDSDGEFLFDLVFYQ
ncbi:MAG: hypothetical protein ACUVQ4_07345 [bacterium]